MTTIAILYIIAVFISIAASGPQILKLYRLKASDEFQLSTWVAWLVAQCVSLAYMISISNVLLIVANVLWVSFYLLMVILIVTYRPKLSIRLRIRGVSATVAYDTKTLASCILYQILLHFIHNQISTG